jgi:CheY-like chemotaxis protein
MNSPDNISSWVVLVVDDEIDSIELVSEVLEFQGATVVSASNGQQAIEILDRLRPTLILTDLSMPVVDGWGVLRHVRTTPHLSGIPVIAMTAHAMAGDADRGLAAGFATYITKPISPMNLVQQISEHLAEIL